MLLLRDMCMEDGEAIYNAAYMGLDHGWQCFAYGGNAYIGQALDVMAHEFTHCVTTSVMNTNLYQDDMGAINEAMSDIMGNIIEQYVGATDDTEWLVGENGGMAFRSMLSPHDFAQPEYVWDIYYAPSALSPNEMNDMGGVHTNSSLLNLVAAKLCAQHGMALADAAKFWLTVSAVMTPRTDYQQMVPLLSWALKAAGNDAYEDALGELIVSTRMGETDIPEVMPDGQRQVSVRLPETEAFTGGNWIMMAFQVNTEEIRQMAGTAMEFLKGLFDPDVTVERSGELLDELLGMLHLDPADLDGEDGEDWLDKLSPVFADLLTQHTSWQSAKDGNITMVVNQRPTMYLMINVPDAEGNGGNALVLAQDEWVDVSRLLTEEDGEEASFSDEKFNELAWRLAVQLVSAVMDDSAADNVLLPSAGLEDVSLLPPEEDAELSA